MKKPSAFMDKAVQPRLCNIEELYPQSYLYWQEFIKYIYDNYPDINEEWCHSGKNYGWSFRMRSKKRVVMYFTQTEDLLRVAFALGQYDTDAVLAHPAIPFELKKSCWKLRVIGKEESLGSK